MCCWGGSDEQKRKYLPALATGRKVGAWCLTEPQAGSNIFNDMRAKLSRTSQGWILSGEKTFITLRLEWGDISCPFMTSYGLSLREALGVR